MSRQLQVVYLNNNIQRSVTGTTPNYPRVRNFEIPDGRFFHEGEVEGRRRVAVVGWAVPAQIGFAPDDAVGKQIRNHTVSEGRVGGGAVAWAQAVTVRLADRVVT